MAHAISDTVDQISGDAVNAATPLLNGAAALGERAREFGETAQQKARDFGETAQQRYEATAKAVRSTAAESPITSMLTAAGAGVLLGILLARR